MNHKWIYWIIASFLVTFAPACGGPIDGGGNGNGGNGGSADPPATGENLVMSPGAEGDSPLSGWNDTGCLSATPYGEGDGPTSSSAGPSDRGDNYFSARDLACNDTVAAVQWIEGVDGLREKEIAGDIPYDFELRGYLGGWAEDPDHVTFSAYFLNRNDRLLKAATIGPITEADRNKKSKLLERKTSDNVPDGTVRIMLLLEYRRFGAGMHKGVADNLSFMLTEKNNS